MTLSQSNKHFVFIYIYFAATSGIKHISCQTGTELALFYVVSIDEFEHVHVNWVNDKF